ncbi:hypothetical protein EYF80_031419 [Liparis tanakae]|uniref:Uncharacterized protein n=1 Tax=Liparis tanakae TaxID=230148 RepID=A0A4Z2GXW6_9TELE|nr:hypothetical protein EYF80_031419 [Liparis tanakae]
MAQGPAYLSQSAPPFQGESITLDLAWSHSLTQQDLTVCPTKSCFWFSDTSLYSQWAHQYGLGLH